MKHYMGILMGGGVPGSCPLRNDWVDIFYRVANPSIWMYYLPDPSTNPSIICLHVNSMACVPGLLSADIFYRQQ